MGTLPAAPPDVVGQVFESMDDGVLVVDGNGAIVTCNRAAAEVLGLDAPPAAGASFAETFLLQSGLDAFTEAVLDAVRGTGDGGRRVVDLEVAGEPRSVALATSYLRGDAGPNGPGVVGPGAAVVAVFSDLTEVAALREAEVRLGRKVEAQFSELSEAYRAIESRNAELSAKARQARIARGLAAGGALAVLAVLGAWGWQADMGLSGLGLSDLVGAAPAAPAADGDAPATWTVTPGPLRQTTSVVGRIEPGSVTRVLSPAAGTVVAVHVAYGAAVAAGEALVTLDVSAAEREYRSTRAQYLEARRNRDALHDWEQGREMAAARRQAARARDALERQRRAVEQTAYLLAEGVIPAAEHEAAEAALARLAEDQAAALREIEAVRERGGAEARERADLEYQNLRDQLETLRAVVAARTVTAPAPGVVMPAGLARRGAAGGAGPDGRLLSGMAVSRGQVLLRLADTATFAVTAAVEEVEVTKLRVGQAVRVTGDAFPGLELQGELVEVAAHAGAATMPGGAGAQFPVRARLEAATPEQRAALRIGMSVDLHVTIRDDAAVLTVPLGAVRRGPDGLAVRVLDPASGAVRSVAVETGATTPDAVEITAGVAPGDRVVVPAP